MIEKLVLWRNRFFSLSMALLLALNHSSCVSYSSRSSQVRRSNSNKSTPFQPGKASFSISIKGLMSPYSTFFVSALPEEAISIRSHGGSDLLASATSGDLVVSGTDRWTWKAPPQSGLCTLRFEDQASQESVTIHAFVLVPIEKVKEGRLNGFHIGRYPSAKKSRSGGHKPPRGFIEVNQSIAATRLSPHFQLNQFLSQQKSTYPKYLYIDERLVLKLERIVEDLNEKGYRCDTLHVMSGFRTPYYNRLIRAESNSLHTYGLAVDFVVDADPRDRKMDDLNNDGRINREDGMLLFNLIDKLDRLLAESRLQGGLGFYKKSKVHGPFVHVDVRSYQMRWKA